MLLDVETLISYRAFWDVFGKFLKEIETFSHKLPCFRSIISLKKSKEHITFIFGMFRD